MDRENFGKSKTLFRCEKKEPLLRSTDHHLEHHLDQNPQTSAPLLEFYGLKPQIAPLRSPRTNIKVKEPPNKPLVQHHKKQRAAPTIDFTLESDEQQRTRAVDAEPSSSMAASYNEMETAPRRKNTYVSSAVMANDIH